MGSKKTKFAFLTPYFDPFFGPFLRGEINRIITAKVGSAHTKVDPHMGWVGHHPIRKPNQTTIVPCHSITIIESIMILISKLAPAKLCRS
jgi:hypothetical protein